jgi:hypothetical protein
MRNKLLDFLVTLAEILVFITLLIGFGVLVFVTVTSFL